MTDLTYRKALSADIEYLLWLRKETMNEHLAHSGISLTDEDHLLRVNYLFEHSRIIVSEGQNIGLLKVEEKKDNFEIIQIQIDPKYQGKGIGQQVIKTIIENALSIRKSISLSVLKENKAKALYERMGFSIVGEDDNSFIMLLKHTPVQADFLTGNDALPVSSH